MPREHVSIEGHRSKVVIIVVHPIERIQQERKARTVMGMVHQVVRYREPCSSGIDMSTSSSSACFLAH